MKKTVVSTEVPAPNEEDVHLIAKRPGAKKWPTLLSPLAEVATACRSSWSERPRTTFHPGLVTCDACKLYIAARQIQGVWWKGAA